MTSNEGDRMPISEHSDATVVLDAATRHAAHLRWLGYPKQLRQADEIDAAVGRYKCAAAELGRQEGVMVAADRLREAYDAMLDGRDIGRLPDWQCSRSEVTETR